MFDYFGRKELDKQKKFQKLRDNILRPLVEFLTRLNIKANYITYFSILLFFIAIFIIYQHPIIGGILGFFYCLLDGLDGPLARYQGTASKAGSLLDIFTDQLGIIFIPIFSIIYLNTNPIFAYIFGMFYILDIILIIILNYLNQRVNFIIRVKYLYYFVFLLSCYLKRDLIYYFHLIFGIFYLLHFIYLFTILIKIYKNDK